MSDPYTTITVNGATGSRFLASLVRYGIPVPPVLDWLVESGARSVDVGKVDADAVASFLDALLDAGWIDVDEPPLLFSPQVGEVVALRRDVLVELARPVAERVWIAIPRGTRGRVIARRRDDGRDLAIVELLEGDHRRARALVSTRNVGRC